VSADRPPNDGDGRNGTNGTILRNTLAGMRPRRIVADSGRIPSSITVTTTIILIAEDHHVVRVPAEAWERHPCRSSMTIAAAVPSMMNTDVDVMPGQHETILRLAMRIDNIVVLLWRTNVRVIIIIVVGIVILAIIGTTVDVTIGVNQH
jgi:hypothetical protein